MKSKPSRVETKFINLAKNYSCWLFEKAISCLDTNLKETFFLNPK